MQDSRILSLLAIGITGGTCQKSPPKTITFLPIGLFIPHYVIHYYDDLYYQYLQLEL